MGNLATLYLRCRLSARCEGMSEGAGEGLSAAVWSPRRDWQALQWNLSRYEDKLEQSDAVDQESFSPSDVILLV